MSWIEDVQGVTTILDEAGDPVQRRKTVQFIGADVADDGEKTVVDITRGEGATPEVITGDATPATVAELKQAVDSIIAALVARGIATDGRA
jgi:hypothetical protein